MKSKHHNDTDGPARKLVKAATIASISDVTPRCVYGWAGGKRITSYRISGTVRFDLAEVMDAIKSA